MEDAPTAEVAAAEVAAAEVTAAYPKISYADLEDLSDSKFQDLLNYMVSRIRAAMKAREDRRVRDAEDEFLRYITAWDIAFSNEMVGTVTQQTCSYTDGFF
jgi:hypothetical protein